MEIKLNNKVMNWDEVRFDITLMAYERIFSEFLRRDIFKLGWFQGYQKGDLQRLEAILHQADQQYESLPGEEQQWIDELQEFYTDFNSFDWDYYKSIRDNEPARLEYELETSVRWAKKIKNIVVNSNTPSETGLANIFNHPLQHLLTRAGLKSTVSSRGVVRMKETIQEDGNDKKYQN